jgi:hypothetical protein
VEEVKPGEPFLPAPNPCNHLILTSLRTGEKPSGADYALQILSSDLYNAPRGPGVFGVEVDPKIVEILKKHFAFVEDMAFARSEAERDEARKEVSDYLRSLGYEVPPA